MTNYVKAVAVPITHEHDAEYVEMTPDEIMARQLEENLPAQVPLSIQLEQVFEQLTPEQQADFSATRTAVKNELSEGRINIAKLVIERATIPADLEEVRQALLEIINAI